MKITYRWIIALLFFSSIGCGVDDGSDAREVLMEAFGRFGDSPIEDDGGYFYSVINPGSGDLIANEDFIVVGWRAFDINTNVLQTTGDFPAVGAVSSFNALDNTNLRRLGKGGVVRIYIPALIGQSPENAQIYELTVEEVYSDVGAYNKDVIEAYIESNNLTTQLSDDGIYYIIDEQGDGEAPNSQSVVSVVYEGYFLNGDSFDSSNEESVTFSLQQVIDGWTLGIPLFNVGGSGTLIIPSNLAYGNSGSQGAIPPNYPIAFDVELVGIE